MVWRNDDGLVVKFGIEEAKQRAIGEYSTDGPDRLVEIVVNVETLPLIADGSTVIDYGALLPEGAYIDHVEVVQSRNFESAGAAFVLNVGTVDVDTTSNADADGIVAGITETEWDDEETDAAGWIGAQVRASTVLTSAKLLTWEVTGAQPTDGNGVIRIKYKVPAPYADTLVWDKSA